MADRIIDYDRGVIIQNHPGSGMDVFMYVDMPGQYFTAHGKAVPEQIAKEANFDVDKLGKERLRLKRKAEASAIIDAELADEKDIDQKVVQEKDGFKLISIGLGRHNILDEDGNIINAQHLSLEMAQKLFYSFTGGPEDVKNEKSGKGK